MNTPFILAELILPILLGTTRAPTTPVELRHDSHTIEITIVERTKGERPTRTEVELPDNGKLRLWVASGETRRFCEIETDAADDRGASSIQLRCRPGVNGPDELTVEARPHLRRGKATVLAKLERADGRALEVTATLR